MNGRNQHETSPPTISISRRGRCRAAGRLAHRERASLSYPAGAHHCCLCPRRRGGHHRAPDRPVAFRPARSILHHGESAGSRRQHRDRGRRQCTPRRPYVAAGHRPQRGQRRALREAQLQLYPRHRAGRGRHSRADGHPGASIVSGHDGRRAHRLCQSQSRQRSTWPRRAPEARLTWRASSSAS